MVVEMFTEKFFIATDTRNKIIFIKTDKIDVIEIYKVNA